MSTKTVAAFTLVAVVLAVLASYLFARSHPTAIEPQTAAEQVDADLNKLTEGAAFRADAGSQTVAAPPVVEDVSPPLLQDLESCMMLTGVDDATECIDEWLTNRRFPTAEREIGSLICFVNSTADAPFDTRPLTRAITRTLIARASGDIIASIEAIRDACPRVATEGCIARAVMNLRDADADLFEHIRQSLVAERVFDVASGDGAIRLAVNLADELDDSRLKQLVIDGAHGKLGGTEVQTDLAAICAMRYFEKGENSLAYAEELLSAPILPDGTWRSGLGSTLACLVTSPHIAGACEKDRVLSVLQAILDDPSVGFGAAAQIARQMNPERPPDGLSVAEWGEIWRVANEMDGEKGRRR